MPDRNRLHDALLSEGLASYLDAITAIDEFTKAIQKDCRSVLERQISSLQAASGLKFSEKELTEYSEPYKTRTKLWTAQDAYIGAELPVVNSAKLYSMDAGLAWIYENGKTSVYFYSGLYTKQLSALDELNAKLTKYSNAEFEVDKTAYGLILWGDGAVGSDGQYRLDALEKVVVEWVSIWKKAGGVEKIFSRKK